MINTSSSLESTRGNEAACLSLAIGLHALALLWNPIILRSDWHPAHDFVTVDVVEQSAPGSEAQNEPKPKMSLMDTLKDMLMKPKTEEIAHVAPEPVVPRVAAPLQPALQERAMPRPIATAFQPQSQAEDLAMANAPSQINAARNNLPNVPLGGPTLKTKSFGGIQAKDLPFQMGGSGDAIATGGQSVIPVAIGNNSAKAALSYGGPALTDTKNHHMGIVPSGLSGGTADLNSIGAGAASTIQLSGTGGTGNAPTGAASGSSLHDRAGSGGGLVNHAMFGSGSGSGGAIESMPSAAQELDNQLASASGTSSGKGAKKNQGFDIAGPLNNRPIVHKVIPQYPAWAEEQGIIGSVRLYFTVTPEGTVRANIRVTKTTGYPQLDQLGIDALKKWQFAPLSSDDEGKGEWGIITFNFSLSS